VELETEERAALLTLRRLAEEAAKAASPTSAHHRVHARSRGRLDHTVSGVPRLKKTDKPAGGSPAGLGLSGKKRERALVARQILDLVHESV
jgi:hypothetical protein